jgi:hypothetical protein
MKLVPIKNAILNLVENTDDPALLRKEPLLMKWAVAADWKIGSQSQFKKNIEVLTVNNCCVDLPCDAVIVAGIAVGDYGCDCGFYFDQVLEFYKTSSIETSDDITLTFSWTDGALQFNYVDWAIQGGKIVFPLGLDDDTKITVMYFGYEKDAQGYPLVSDNNIDAIEAYLMLKLVRQKEWKLINTKGNYYMSSRAKNEYTRDWNREVRNARAENSGLSSTQLDEISELMNNPLSGKGNVMLEKDW